jgi:hypothetical protein
MRGWLIRIIIILRIQSIRFECDGFVDCGFEGELFAGQRIRVGSEKPLFVRVKASIHDLQSEKALNVRSADIKHRRRIVGPGNGVAHGNPSAVV